MKKLFFAIAMVVFITSFSSCGGGLGLYISETLSPPHYVRPVSPYNDAIWISGEWIWVGGKYEWREGHWAHRRVGRAWIEGHWERQDRGHIWIKGHWS